MDKFYCNIVLPFYNGDEHIGVTDKVECVPSMIPVMLGKVKVGVAEVKKRIEVNPTTAHTYLQTAISFKDRTLFHASKSGYYSFEPKAEIVGRTETLKFIELK